MDDDAGTGSTAKAISRWSVSDWLGSLGGDGGKTRLEMSEYRKKTWKDGRNCFGVGDGEETERFVRGSKQRVVNRLALGELDLTRLLLLLPQVVWCVSQYQGV